MCCRSGFGRTVNGLGCQKNITDEALAACIAKAFEDCFASYDTVLEGGARGTPLPTLSSDGKPAKLVFREDFPHRLCMRLRIGALPALGAASKKILATNTFAAP